MDKDKTISITKLVRASLEASALAGAVIDFDSIWFNEEVSIDCLKPIMEQNKGKVFFASTPKPGNQKNALVH